jgi:stearoyl-CoA desaturase (delta-9 desaturase)
MALLDVLNRQHYDTGDGSRNSFALALLTNGEGWHNHHHYPASARQGFHWWQVAGTFTFLRVLSWLRLVRDLKTPPASILNARLLSANNSVFTPKAL